jgi:hypothetical protein
VPLASKMLISELRDRTRQGFLEFAWRQWAQAGLSVNATGLDDWAIDPEALILFTIAVARHDPRLFDEMLDWLAGNRRLLTTQRLRNLTGRFPVDARLVVAVMAWTGDPPPPHWLKTRDGTGLNAENMPVFSPDVLGFVGEPDPIFAQYGYIRPRVTRSGKSREPDLKIRANLAFQLRHLFGPGSRSEVMRLLLTFPDGPLDAARISDESGFAERNVSDTLAGLAAARAIKARWSGNERHFSAYRDKWAAVLEVGPSPRSMPSFVSWVHLLPAALEILTWLDNEVGTKDSEYLVSSRARRLMQQLTHDLEIAGINLTAKRPAHGTAYLPVFAEAVESLLAMMSIGQ